MRAVGGVGWGRLQCIRIRAANYFSKMPMGCFKYVYMWSICHERQGLRATKNHVGVN